MNTIARLRGRTAIFIGVTGFCCVALSTALRGQPAASGKQAGANKPAGATETPAVLALDVNGQPAFVSAAKPVPISLVNAVTPLPVLDGGIVLTASGSYTFVFPATMSFPGINGPISGFPVVVQKVRGKWVLAQYRTSDKNVHSAWFNTEQLLAIGGLQ
jgi:hypothetical protein